MSSNLPRRLRRRQGPFANIADWRKLCESEISTMLDPYESRKPTPEEQKQIRYLDKLEEAMDCDLKANCSLADEWISHLENELEKPDYCQEAKQRINRLLYHIVDGTYDQPDNAYADQE